MAKIVSLARLAALVEDGSTVAFGGSFLHRAPNALVRELVRRGTSGLDFVKPSPGYDLDLLCRAGALRRARVGIAAMDADLGLLPHFRRAVERRELDLEEHSCITLVSGLRAAAFGVPFLPVAGLDGSDIPGLNGWQRVRDPYGSGAEPYVVPALRPDVAVLHVNEIDEDGNARVYGSPHWDRPMSRSAGRVLVTAERLVPRERIREQPELTLVPSFMVESAAIVPRGAWPASLHPDYGMDVAAVQAYLADDLERHLDAAPEAAAALV